MMFDGDCYVPEEKDRLPPLSPVRSRISLRRMVEDIQELRRPSHTIIEEFTRYSALRWALLCSLLSNDVLYILSIRSAFLRWLVTQSGLALSEGNYRSSHSTMKCDSSKARCLVVRRLIVRSLVSPFDLVPSTSYDVASPQSSLNCGDTCTTGTTTPKSICSSCTCGQSRGVQRLSHSPSKLYAPLGKTAWHIDLRSTNVRMPFDVACETQSRSTAMLTCEMNAANQTVVTVEDDVSVYAMRVTDTCDDIHKRPTSH